MRYYHKTVIKLFCNINSSYIITSLHIKINERPTPNKTSKFSN